MRKWVSAAVTGRVFHSALATPLGRVTWAGRHLDIQLGRMPMRQWDTYSAVYVLKGHGWFYDPKKRKLPLQPGDLMLMFPRHGYRYEVQEGELWSEFFIQFRGPLFGLWMKEGLLDPRRPIHHLEPIDHWWKRLEAIIKPLSLSEPTQSLKRVCMLQDFFVDAVIAPLVPMESREREWLSAARALLERDLGSPVDWEALAKRLGLSYHMFRKKFGQLGGVPPSRYRAAKIIERAEDMLHDRRLSMRDISRQCGFHDEFHFAKRFKDATGLTPAQFRRRLH